VHCLVLAVPTRIDYTSTKGAILAFTRALSLNLAERGIRVNAVAPGTPALLLACGPKESGCSR